MTDQDQRVLNGVGAALGSDRMARVVVYVSRDQAPAGAHLRFGDATIEVPWDADIVFVDLEPGVNWGHACSYLALRRDGDGVVRVAAHMPPFLKGPSRFRLLWRGPNAPAWAVATEAD